VLRAVGLQEAIERVASVPRAKEIRLWSTGPSWKLFDLGAVSVELYRFPTCSCSGGIYTACWWRESDA
jgi:salicylate hydroxylase